MTTALTPHRHCRSFLRIFASALFVLISSAWLNALLLPSAGSTATGDHDYAKRRAEWLLRGRLVTGKSSAELRRRAFQAKLRMRAQRAAISAGPHSNSALTISSASWKPLGPAPLASDASGNGTQDYGPVAGRATAVAIDPADPSGNTIYIGGAQSGIWKSTNAATTDPAKVSWTPLTDDQATLSIGAIAIQPGNHDLAKSVILAATGEANNAADSYFGLGILRSVDGGQSWTLIPSANSGALPFSGLGGTRMAFSTLDPKTVVAAMATSSEGMLAGAITTNAKPGLYTSRDSGQTWTYNALVDSGTATDATSATSVVYNSIAGLFFAAVRYHGFYSSPDGVTWTRLAAQPGNQALSSALCPAQSTSNNQTCPLYRGELAVVPGRNEAYAWFVSLNSDGNVLNEGIWKSSNAGGSWTQISDSGITNCGDPQGCGVEQGFYNLELLAIPKATGTDLYAGSVNLYKCSINTQNPTCSANPFLNLTHGLGCAPISAPAHVHPDQHALDGVIPESGSDSGNALLYFANDGGIYRALDGFFGLTSGSCSGTNQFDNLNQNLGSMTQFVSFSQHPNDPNTLLGGAQGNGSPATNQATTSLAWSNVLDGDGGYSAIDPNMPTSFFASNPDVPPGGLNIQLCSGGVNCNNLEFTPVITSSDLGGDDGAFYVPYILDPQSSGSLLVGTCRIWRGPRAGGAFAALGPNFETYGAGTCSGNEVNLVRAIAAGGPTDDNGSTVIYATTSGLGPISGPLEFPSGGHVWVSTNATAGPVTFSDTTNNGPQGSINPNQFPISGVSIDPADPSGQSAFVTIMGFTGGTGHVWKTKTAGLSWTDFTSNLPDSPVNAIVIDASASMVFVGTDVGVFASSTVSPQWTEVGPVPGSGHVGFLPNVAVTGLALFQANGRDLLRVATYGRGMWQVDLLSAPDYQISIANSPLTIFAGQNATFNGAATGQNGYANSVTMGCVADTTPPPSTCSVSPSVITPGANQPFTVTAGGSAGDYSFKVQAVGADPDQITRTASITLHVFGFGLTAPSPTSVSTGGGTTSPGVSFQVTAAGSFNQSVTLSCSLSIPGASCVFTPGSSVNPTSSSPVNATVTVSVPAGTTAGNYPVTIQAATAGAPAPITVQFTLKVTTNPDFSLTGPVSFPQVNAGSTGTKASIQIAALDGFNSRVSLTCSTQAGANVCGLNPTSVSSFPATSNLSINASTLAAGTYTVSVSGNSGSLAHSIDVPFNVGDFALTGTQNLSSAPGGQATAHLTVTSLSSYSGTVNATCDATSLASASCTISPSNPISVGTAGTSLNANINVPNNAASGNYNIKVAVQDTTGTPSHSFTVSLTVVQDFALTSSTPSQTISAGQTTGPYNLTIQPVGSSFNAPVTLACSGLPAGAQCSFSPSTPVTPGSSRAQVIMSISTTGATSNSLSQSFRVAVALLLVPGLLLLRVPRRRVATCKPFPAWISVLALLAPLLSLLSCGGASTGGGGGGGGGDCSAAPNAPTGVVASATTTTGTTLNWNPSSAVAGCTVSYVVYQDGVQKATVSGTTYNVTGLSPGTQHSFAVAATDAAGTSALSTAINVTTLSNGTPPGVYTITVTGSSSGTPGDAGQSTQVQLVVN